MIASYRELDYSTSWTNWTEHTKYTRRRYAKYSAGRLCIEALCYAVLAFLVRCTVQLSAAPQTKWSVIAVQFLAFAVGGFSVLSVLALIVISGPVVADLIEMLSEPWSRPAAREMPFQSVPHAEGAPAIDGLGPPIAPSLLLELVLPRRDRATVIGDLEETYYNELLPKYGRNTAGLLYWTRCVREALFYSWPLLRKVVPWGIVAATLCTGRLKWLAEVVHNLAR